MKTILIVAFSALLSIFSSQVWATPKQIDELGPQGLTGAPMSIDAATALLINKTLDGVDATVGFLEAEIPDYIYQLMLWHGWYNFTLFIVGGDLF